MFKFDLENEGEEHYRFAEIWRPDCIMFKLCVKTVADM